ncbi:MAG: serine/threonine-protein kinase [Bacteroidota bacterium]
MTPASPERWRILDALFEAALNQPTHQQQAYLREACGSDLALYEEALQLLEEAQAAQRLLGESVAAYAPEAVQAALSEAETAALERVGPYRVLHEVGRGGMGTVYVARRDDGTFAKDVALKVVRRGLDTDDILRRFRYERQLLARLEHPHIAHLLDGGRTDDGRPYLVMEYVVGTRLDHFCTDRGLSMPARLALLLQVIQAVHHAHRALIVHRDLKPSNILVTDAGQVKLLDFGIAKLLVPDADVEAPHTRTTMRILTPEYASPEQREGGPLTTATDVYALGVLIHEVLTGHRPAAEPADPQPLPGDLALIVRKAMAETPEDRYASAEALAADLHRYLDGHPVHARPASAGYRLRKFVQRHQAGVAATALCVVLGLVFTLFYTVRITQARNHAEAEAARAQATVSFLETLFEDADPDVTLGDTLTVFDLLARGAHRLDDLDSQPATQASVRQTLGHLFLRLGDDEAAEHHLEAAQAVQAGLSETEPYAATLHSLGLLAFRRTHYDEADSFFQAALRLRRQTGTSVALAQTLNDYGAMLAYSGQYEAAVRQFEDALRLLAQQPGDVREVRATSQFGLASVHMNEARYDEAEALYQQVLATRRALYGPLNTQVADALNDLGNLYAETRRLEEADSLLRQALAQRRQLFGEDHPEVSTSLNNLAYLLFEQGDFSGAETMFAEAMATTERREGRENRDVALTLSNIGWTRQNQGDMPGAEAAFREALGIMQRVVGPESADAALVLGNVAWTLHRQGRLAEAERFYRDALTARRLVHGDTSMHVAWRQFALAEVIREQARPAEAEALYRASLGLRRHLRDAVSFDVGRGLNGLGLALLEQTRYAEAEPLHREAVAVFEALPDSTNLALAQSRLGAALTGLARYDEAESVLEASWGFLEARAGREHRWSQATLRRLVSLHEAQGRADEAAAYEALLQPEAS